MNQIRVGLFLLLVCSFISCSDNSDSIVGTWEGVDKFGNFQTLKFYEDLSAVFIIKTKTRQDTLKINYEIFEHKNPKWLNLYNFNRGFLKNKNLYCIYEIKNNVLRLDAEAGGLNNSDAVVRPKEFTSETVEYKRLE